MTEKYLGVLEESLEKKIQILTKIQEFNLRQQEILQAQDVEVEKFDECVDRKGELIEELTALDSGFEALYENLSNELQGNREKYAERIRRLQELVSEVMEQSVTIQAQEARNKKLVEDYFRRERKQLSQTRKNSQAAYDYYKSMSQSNVASPQFMDSKQ